MKKLILKKLLAVLARKTVQKYKPKIVGITGSVGKTSTKEAIFSVLKNKFHVRTAEKNYNNEIGLPLTILGISHFGNNIAAWLLAFVQAVGHIYFYKTKYPEILILEYGIDHPGDMDHLLSIAIPDIGIITALGETPVHVEFFEGPEAVAQEKEKLIRSLSSNGHAILNHDDEAVYDMKERTRAHVFTFGFEAHAEIRITNYELRITKGIEFGDMPDGVSFKIQYKGNTVPFRLSGAFGKPHAYATASAAAVGITFGMNLVEIAEVAKNYVPPPGRMRLLKGIKRSLILDDSYNAAPEAMYAALDTLQSLPGKRKIAILGDMLEIGKFSEQVHRTVGDRAAKFVDILFCVGPRAKFIADEARIKGLEHVMQFDDSTSAGKALDPLIGDGDLILIKGSQAMRMEEVVEEIMAQPERAKDLLVRQEAYWKFRNNMVS